MEKERKGTETEERERENKENIVIDKRETKKIRKKTTEEKIKRRMRKT